MVVGVVLMWDRGWSHPDYELTQWTDFATAFNLDFIVFIPDLKYGARSEKPYLYQYDTLDDALADVKNKYPDITFVFLEPKSIADANNVPCESLTSFDHPESALYILGNSGHSNIGYVDTSRGDKVVYVPTIVDHQIWSVQAMAIAIYDRAKKAWLI